MYLNTQKKRITHFLHIKFHRSKSIDCRTKYSLNTEQTKDESYILCFSASTRKKEIKTTRREKKKKKEQQNIVFFLSVKCIKIAWVHMSRLLEHTIFIKRWAREYLYDFHELCICSLLCFVVFIYVHWPPSIAVERTFVRSFFESVFLFVCSFICQLLFRFHLTKNHLIYIARNYY